jgi:hypothetical protein
MKRGSKYLPMIQSVFRREGLPWIWPMFRW